MSDTRLDIYVHAAHSCEQKSGSDARLALFAFQPADVPKPVSAPGPVLKANSLSNLEQEKSTYRYVVLITAPQAAERRVKDNSEILAKASWNKFVVV